MALVLKTAPESEPITAVLVKSFSRISTSADDTLIGYLITRARRMVEKWTRRQFMPATWQLILDEWPTIIELPRPPLRAVSSIKYVDTAGDSTTWSSDEYQTDSNSEPGRITPAVGYSYPSTRGDLGCITVEYTAGYDDADAVPEEYKQAMYLLVGHWYENREPYAQGKMGELEASLKALIHVDRIPQF